MLVFFLLYCMLSLIVSSSIDTTPRSFAEVTLTYSICFLTTIDNDQEAFNARFGLPVPVSSIVHMLCVFNLNTAHHACYSVEVCTYVRTVCI